MYKSVTAGQVVLGAGAVGSVHILDLSGIGQLEVLRRAGIAPMIEHSNVGENLQDHLQLRLVYKVHGVKSLNTMASTLWGKAMIAAEYAWRRTGPMAMAPSQVGILTRSDHTKETPDLEYHVQPVSLDKFGDVVHPFPAMTASVCNVRLESRGTIHISRGDVRAHPVISPNYLTTQGDRDVAAHAIAHVRRIASQPAFAKHDPVEYKPGPDYVIHDDLIRAAGETGTTIFHPVGTCRMGVVSDAVVDSRLRLRGVEGRRIADASVMPQITSGNTNAPTMMIAGKAARMILEDARA